MRREVTSSYRNPLAAALGTDCRGARIDTGRPMKIAVILTEESDGSDRRGSSGGSEKWLDSRSILEIEPTSFLTDWVWSRKEREVEEPIEGWHCHELRLGRMRVAVFEGLITNSLGDMLGWRCPLDVHVEMSKRHLAI